MSRIGKKPVPVPAGVTATVSGQTVTAKGPKGELFFVANDEVVVKLEDNNAVSVTPVDQSKDARSKWGMSRTMIENIGFSHDVVYQTPEGISIAVPKPTEIVVTGINKQQVGQVAAEIREYRGPEPYKGKGVKYAGERIVRKEGKKK
jgi:large subunit ribosomal protein L6